MVTNCPTVFIIGIAIITYDNNYYHLSIAYFLSETRQRFPTLCVFHPQTEKGSLSSSCKEGEWGERESIHPKPYACHSWEPSLAALWAVSSGHTLCGVSEVGISEAGR